MHTSRMPDVESAAVQAVPSGVHERRRAEIVATIPSRYSPALHLAIPSILGLSVMLAAALRIRELSFIELLAVPITYVSALALEWRAHKSILHGRIWPLDVLYVRHELHHHVIYTGDDMAMRNKREMRLILMPAYAIVLAFSLVVPLAAVAWLLVSRNVAMLIVVTSMLFFLSYEWLHLSYHLPPDSRIGRLSFVARLRELHRRHHDPRLMKRWNFNVTIPLFDVIHRSLWSRERERERDRRREVRAGLRRERPVHHST
jgi:hypothetical protein